MNPIDESDFFVFVNRIIGFYFCIVNETETWTMTKCSLRLRLEHRLRLSKA